MKIKPIFKLGLILTRISPLKICIVDDQKSYFTDQMLSLANSHNNISFERYYKVDETLLKNLIQNPRDIVILDIKGIVDSDFAKDGFDIAKHLKDNSNSFIVVTSAHKFHLKDRNNYGDYILTERLLTPIDFSTEVNLIIDRYLAEKSKFYKKILFKVGKMMIKKNVLVN